MMPSGFIVKITLILLVLIALAVTPPPAMAEKTVGVIMTGDIDYYHSIHQSFIDTMGGGDINFVVQVPNPEPMAWANAARKLVVIGSDMIITYGAPATLTVMKQTSSIPILFAGVYDPKAMNIVGKNATGISSKISVVKLLENMKLIKDFKTLGIVYNKSEKDTILQVMEVKKLEAKMGFSSRLYDARKKGFDTKINNVDAVLLTTSCTAMCTVTSLVNVARKQKLLTGSTITGGEDHGIIFTMSADPTEQGRVVGEMAQMLLNGHLLSSIPLREPKEIGVTVNSAEAAKLGLTVPASVIGAASRALLIE